MSGGSIKGYINYGGCNKFNGRYISSSLFNKNEYYFKIVADNNINYTYVDFLDIYWPPHNKMHYFAAPFLKAKLYISIGNYKFSNIYNDILIIPSLEYELEKKEALLYFYQNDVNYEKILFYNKNNITEENLKTCSESITNGFLNNKSKKFKIINSIITQDGNLYFTDTHRLLPNQLYNYETFGNSFESKYINYNKLNNLYKNKILKYYYNGKNKEIKYLGNFYDKVGKVHSYFGIHSTIYLNNNNNNYNIRNYVTGRAENTMEYEVKEEKDCFTNYNIIENYFNNSNIKNHYIDKEYSDGLSFKEIAGKTFIYKIYKGG